MMYDHYGPPPMRPYSYNYRPRPRGYGLSNIVGDLTLIGATLGVWIFFIIGREVTGGWYGYRTYGFSNFVGDVTLVGITCGLWLLWIFFREASRR